MEVLAIRQRETDDRADGLVERARRGDFDAFEALYRGQVGRIHAICLRMTADPERARDLTQDTFVQAWQKLADLRDPAGFPGWLRKIAIHAVLGDRRGRGKREAAEAPIDNLLEFRPYEAGEDPGGTVDLERAIAALPPQARRVFVLHDVEGYPHPEIGRLLGVTPGTSKSQLHRARRLLRERLER